MLKILNALAGKNVSKRERYVLLSIAICMAIVLLNAKFDFAQGHSFVIILAMLVWFYFGGLFFLFRASLRSFLKVKRIMPIKDSYGCFLYSLNAICFLVVAVFYSGYFMPSTAIACSDRPVCDIQEMKMAIFFGVMLLGALYTLWKIRKYESTAN